MPFGSRSWLQAAPGGFHPYRLVNWHGSGMGSWWWTTRAARSRSCSSPTSWCWSSSSGCCCSSPSAWSWSYPPCTRVAAQGRLGWRCQLQAIPFLLKKNKFCRCLLFSNWTILVVHTAKYVNCGHRWKTVQIRGCVERIYLFDFHNSKRFKVPFPSKALISPEQYSHVE